MKITKKVVLKAIELAKINGYPFLSDHVEITIDAEMGQVILWNAEGDYDATYAEADIEGIVKEARFIETFYTRKAK